MSIQGSEPDPETDRGPAAARAPAVDPQLLQLIRFHPDGILVVEDSGRIVHANPAARRLLRGDPEAAIDDALLGVPIQCGRGVVIETGPPARRRLRMSVEDGSWGGRLARFVTLRALRPRPGGRRPPGPSRDRGLALLAHELRAPLASMLGVLDAARLDPSTGEDALVLVEHQARRLGRLLGDLVDGARLDRRAIPIRPEPIDLGHLASWAADAVRPFVEHRRQRLELTLPDGPVPMAGDRTWIEQVLLHLLTNASKYTEPGGTIRIQAVVEGDTAVIRVRDDGIGIAPDDLGRIFEPFRRGSSDDVRSREGQGIGLAVVRSIIERHRGAVSAASAGIGSGSTFTVQFPVATAGLAPIVPASPVGETAVDAAAPVLLVDDDVLAVESLAQILRIWGCEVRTSHDGAAALAEAMAEPPRFVIIDRRLPGLDGEAFARRLRDEPTTASAVLICLSGDSRRPGAPDDPFDHHLLKPVDLDALAPILSAPTDRFPRPSALAGGRPGDLLGVN